MYLIIIPIYPCIPLHTPIYKERLRLYKRWHYYTVSLTQELQRRNESTTLSRIFSDKNLFRNPKSTLTAHTGPPPEYLAKKSFPLAALQPFDEGQSRAS